MSAREEKTIIGLEADIERWSEQVNRMELEMQGYVAEVERLREANEKLREDVRQWAMLSPDDPAGPDYAALLAAVDA